MTEQYQNNYTTTLNTTIDNDDTTIIVNDAPTMTGTFRIKIDNEIILVGSVSGTTFSGCTRGVEGTTATTHTAGATVRHVLTRSSLLTFGRGMYLPKYNPDHETPTTTPAIAAEFNGALDTNWSWSSAPTTEIYTNPGYMVLKHNASSGGRLARAWSPGSNATLAAKFSMNVQSTAGTTRAYILGMSDTDSTTPTNFNGIYILGYSNNFTITTITRTGGSWTAGTEFQWRQGGLASGFIYTRQTYQSGTGTLYWSLDGVSWAQFPNTTSLSLTISHALLLADAQAAFNSTWDWIRGWNSVVENVGA